ncbi:two-component system regulatory protein YycI [Periweissella fabaria]|uniref:Two-component system WalR/WalK regulatory protein YycI n=1 Tax=Periweissella fabaria TaxID=546157 RepID=A0ABM8Z5M2_9LACO|nr:two-component system regulatory protein YycI [Periweissella fabaria]MCM0596928.1 two-component system regulatory protein YycI [Periweissella fabaria]CAH0416666.1 Two-component system WalR/WalK regulatory protein YycI [Periweissella fabaria]
MDFKRIQWIFLLIFVAIDVFLGLQWYQGIQFDTVDTVGSTSVLKEMQGDDISFKRPSDKVGEGFYIAGQDGPEFTAHMENLRGLSTSYNSSTRTLTAQLGDKKRFKLNFDNPQRTLDHFIRGSQNVLHGDEYVFSEELSQMDKHEIVYVQVVPSGKVYDSSGEVHFKLDDDGYVSGYTQTYVSQPKILREKTPTISEEKALTWLYQYNQIPNNTTVLWTKLAYTKLLDVNNTTVYVPTWFFGLRTNNSDNVRIKRINAFTGTIVKDTPQKVNIVNELQEKEVIK